MSDEATATVEVDAEIKGLGDKIAGLTIKQAVDLKNYLKDAYARSQDPEIAAHLGEVLWVTGETARAREIFDEALHAHPDNPVLQRTVDRFVP